MRVTTLALSLAGLLALASPAMADPVADCNGDQTDLIIKGCTDIIKAGKSPDDALAIVYFNRANAYDDSGDESGAIADYTQSIKLKADYPPTYVNRAMTYEKTGDLDNAIADYKAAIKLAPDFAKARFGLARAYEGKGDFKQALAGYQEVLKLAPNSKTVQEKVAEMKKKLGQ